MVQRVVVTMVDDIDGGEADETVKFVLDGVRYQIDLTAEHAEKFRRTMGPWVQHARRVGGRSTVRRRREHVQADVTTIRAWAAANGYDVKPRGRLKQEVIDAFNAAEAKRLAEEARPRDRGRIRRVQ